MTVRQETGGQGARYLLRFDDVCPSMRWTIWERIELRLKSAEVRPILAVIPENRDPKLLIEPPRAEFWDRVRTWQAWGWTIGVHGHQHVWTTTDPGMYGWNARSEFAGLDADTQREKLERALAVFRREEVYPGVWVAPNHAFDATTVSVLRDLGVRVISDGHALYPYRDRLDEFWIPSQLSAFKDRRVGVWTISLHPNFWTARDFDRFVEGLDRYGSRITDVPTLVTEFGDRRRSLIDIAFRLERKIRRARRRREGTR